MNVLEQALEALEATLSILYEDMNMAGGPDEYAAVRTVILQTNDAIAAIKEAIKQQGELLLRAAITNTTKGEA
jgi:hypothetical protein